MKYLKTYENQKYANNIKLWMNKHNLYKVDFHIELNKDICFNMIVKEGDDFYIIYEWVINTIKSNFNEWAGAGSDVVLEYLENMTPEQIEEQRIKNETEKFNI